MLNSKISQIPEFIDLFYVFIVIFIARLLLFFTLYVLNNHR